MKERPPSTMCFPGTSYSIEGRYTASDFVNDASKCRKCMRVEVVKKTKGYVVRRIVGEGKRGLVRFEVSFDGNSLDVHIKKPAVDEVSAFIESKYGCRAEYIDQETAIVDCGDYVLEIGFNEFFEIVREKRRYKASFFERQLGGKMLDERGNVLLIGSKIVRVDWESGKYEIVGWLCDEEKAHSLVTEVLEGLDSAIVAVAKTVDGWVFHVSGDVEGSIITCCGRVSSTDLRYTEKYVRRVLENYGNVLFIESRDKCFHATVENEGWIHKYCVDSSTGEMVLKERYVSKELAIALARNFVPASEFMIDKETAKEYLVKFTTDEREGVVVVEKYSGRCRLKKSLYRGEYVVQITSERFGAKPVRVSVRPKSVRMLFEFDGTKVFVKVDRHSGKIVEEEVVKGKSLGAKLREKRLVVKYFW